MYLEKKYNETRLDYIKRIVYGKLIDKNIIEDFSELSTLVFGQQYSSCETRKRFYGIEFILKILDDMKMDAIKDNDVIQTIEEKKRELRKERKKLQSLNYLRNKEEKIESRFELFYEEISNKIETIKIPNFKAITPNNSNNQYVLTISDVHYGATFESINNKYSRKICKQRFEKLLGCLEKYLIGNGINRIKVLNLGDSLQGILRINDIKMNDISVVECVVEFSQLMASFINALSEFCEVEYYHVPSANHTQNRLLNSKANELAAEDMEKIIINYIADLVKNNDRILVNKELKGDRNIFKVGKFNCIGLHGHQIKNIKNSIRDLSHLHRVFFDYVFLGHYHGGNEICVGESLNNSVEVLVAPSFIGSCPYSDSLALGSKSMTKLYEFNNIDGHISTRNFILN